MESKSSKKANLPPLSCLLMILVVAGVVAVDGGVVLSPLGGEKKRDLGQNYRVVGFLPTWMVGKTLDYCEQLTDMVFLL